MMHETNIKERIAEDGVHCQAYKKYSAIRLQGIDVIRAEMRVSCCFAVRSAAASTG